jgi:D-sedoheptulose 7-phosphate isomerase
MGSRVGQTQGPMTSTDAFARQFLDETADILAAIDAAAIDDVARVIREARDREGRLFLCGSGGGAGHASHAACDFRKLSRIEAYSVTDNVSELTARINDDGWEHAYADWLRASNLRADDCLFVFSVGGGDEARGISVNLVRAIELARERGASIVGIVGRTEGALQRRADTCVRIPTPTPAHVTPQTEGIQAVLWHLLVTHPLLAACEPKWEATERGA